MHALKRNINLNIMMMNHADTQKIVKELYINNGYKRTVEKLFFLREQKNND